MGYTDERTHRMPTEECTTYDDDNEDVHDPIHIENLLEIRSQANIKQRVLCDEYFI